MSYAATGTHWNQMMKMVPGTGLGTSVLMNSTYVVLMRAGYVDLYVWHLNPHHRKRRRRSNLIQTNQKWTWMNSWMLPTTAHRPTLKVRYLQPGHPAVWITAITNSYKTSRRCSYELETLGHVLNQCKTHLGTLISERHDSVLQRVVQGIREGTKKHLRLTVDRKSDHGSNRQRPDIMLFDEENKELIISSRTERQPCKQLTRGKSMNISEFKLNTT